MFHLRLARRFARLGNIQRERMQHVSAPASVVWAKASISILVKESRRTPTKSLPAWLAPLYQTQVRTICGTRGLNVQDRAAFDEKAILYAGYDLNSRVPMSSVDHNPSSAMLVVHWIDGDKQKFPILWLRDNCHCPSCYNLATHTKSKYIQELNLDIKADVTSISDGGRMLDITWSDNHMTSYPSNWLKCNRFEKSGKDCVIDMEMEFFGSDVMSSGRLRTFQFTDVMTSDTVLHDWLMEILLLGISIIKDTPNKIHQIHKLGARIGHILPTTFGEYCNIVAVKDADNIAFKSSYLEPHTDFSFYMQAPSVGLFHCLVQANGIGGENQLIDTFKAAKELREIDPEAFHFLSTKEIEHVALAKNKEITPIGFFHLSRHPMIKLNADGEVQQVITGEYVRSSMLRCHVDEVPLFYRSLNTFNKILQREDNVFCYKLQPGDVLCFNNSRILHGRTAYETSSHDRVERHLQTCYFDMDCVMSRIRTLKNKALRQKD